MYRRAAAEVGKVLDGVDRLPAPLRPTLGALCRLPARGLGQLVTRPVLADEETVDRLAHLAIDLATETPIRGIDQVAVGERIGRGGRLAGETHLLLRMLALLMLADQLRRHQKGVDTRTRLAVQDLLVEQDDGLPDPVRHLIPDHQPAAQTDGQFES